ncbi:hypothetical protein SO802_021043 [Lithocarpus litseifolius]|uniref:pectinesterase n=1 Tax=Lithocarpus litseifolius TaxID=425828 RepID=A0AAW2CE45_9ROSI
MQSLIISTFYFTLSLFVFLNVSKAQTNITKTIIVDQSGKGNFIHVQQAIDSIPSNNQEWTIIHLNPGVYNLQDTLTDWEGRHYFENCYFEGAIDFIWGAGQPIYQHSQINVTASLLGGGNAYITAQARGSDEETNGFVFKYCTIKGTGPAFLGRAYGSHSRVLFYRSVFDEIGCTGPGADMSKRVKWEKNLSEEEVGQLVSIHRFINQEMWLQKQLEH